MTGVGLWRGRHFSGAFPEAPKQPPIETCLLRLGSPEQIEPAGAMKADVRLRRLMVRRIAAFALPFDM